MNGRLVLVACALLAGCASSPSIIVPKGEASVVVDPAQKQTNTTLKMLHRITITLPPAQPSGHEWQIAQHDSRYLQQATEILPSEAPGAGPQISFIAVRPGRTRLRFALVPATTARTVEPVDLREVVVAIE